MSDEAADRITAAIQDAIRAGELGGTNSGMPNGWVLIGGYLDEDGDTRHLFLTNRDGRLHETLGFLQLGKVAWQEQARLWIHDNDEDDD